MQRVRPDSFLTLHYRLRDADGAAIVDTFGDKPATISLGSGELAATVEARMIGLAVGDEASFTFEPGAVFGERSDLLVRRLARSMAFAGADDAASNGRTGETADDDALAVGDVVRLPALGGHSVGGIVRAIDGEALVVDFNHPLAGRRVAFDVKVIGIL